MTQYCPTCNQSNFEGKSKPILDSEFARIESSFLKRTWKIATCSNNCLEKGAVAICIET